MKLLIGIPAYNEEKTIGKVIKTIPHKIPGIDKIDILVIDDGSTDGTFRQAKSSGVGVLHHLINRGLGGALKTVFTYARKYNYDLVVTMDADGQHDGEDTPLLIKPILKRKKDVVIGSRWRKKMQAPLSRKIVNYFANISTYFLYGIWTTDSQSGFRAFSKKSIYSINLSTDGMEVSSEIIGEIKRNNLRLGEIDIKPLYTSYSITKGQQLSNAPNIFINLLLKLLK